MPGQCYPIDREQTISDLIKSISLEVKAIANVLNVEADILLKMVNCSSRYEKLTDINASVNPTINRLIELQRLLLLILEDVSELEEDDE